MAVIRIEKTKNYTVMSNYHFKEKDMSLKAKGLISLMLSLPDDWDYTVNGLATICKENETAIKSALKELQQFGYLQVIKKYPNESDTGRIEYEYIIYEKPIQVNKKQEVENLWVENQGIENHVQLNTEKLNTNNKNNNITNINISNSQNLETNNINTEKTKRKELTKGQKNAIERNKILEDFIKDEPEELQKALKDYVEVRATKGLQAKQLKIILENFEIAYKNKPLSVILEQIKKATARGWMELTYENNFNRYN